MPTKKDAGISENCCSDKNDNTPILIGAIILAALIVISGAHLIINGGKVIGFNFAGVKELARQGVMEVEYSKVGGKENYDIISKLQLQQVEQYVAQYKGKNTDSSDTQKADTSKSADMKTMSQDEIAALKKGSHFEGAKDAKISIYEFSDLECPFCIRQFKEGTIKTTLEKFKDIANSAFKNFPLDFHKNAPKEAEATLCAGEIGGSEKYVEFHNKIFERSTGNGEGFSLDNLVPLAKEIGVNEKKFKECLDSGKMAERIKSDTELGKKYGVTGTPGSVIVNNETGKYAVIAGAYPASEFEAKINELLK